MENISRLMGERIHTAEPVPVRSHEGHVDISLQKTRRQREKANPAGAGHAVSSLGAWGDRVRLEVGRPARGYCSSPSSTCLGKRNRSMIYLNDGDKEIIFKEANSGLLWQVFGLPHQREVCSPHRRCLISKSCVIVV